MTARGYYCVRLVCVRERQDYSFLSLFNRGAKSHNPALRLPTTKRHPYVSRVTVLTNEKKTVETTRGNPWWHRICLCAAFDVPELTADKPGDPPSSSPSSFAAASSFPPGAMMLPQSISERVFPWRRPARWIESCISIV